MAKRARNGQGSIKPRKLADGTVVWDAKVSVKDPLTGVSSRPSVKGLPSEDDAVEWVQAQRAANTRRVKGMTLDDLAQLLWEAGSVKSTTLSHWKSWYKADVRPYLGAMALTEILPMHIDAWVGKIRAKEYKGQQRLPTTLVNRVTVLSAVLEYGVTNRFIDFNWVDASPAVKRLRQDANNHETEAKEIWTAEEFKRFLAEETEPSYWALWCFMAATGVRRGIACGLLWTDVDFDQGLIRPWTNRTVTPDGVKVSTPKGGRRQRLTMDPLLANVLLEQQARQEEMRQQEDWEEHGVVFDAPVLRATWKGEVVKPGRPMDPRRVTERFGRLAEKAKNPPASPHGLRYMWATLARDAGATRDAVKDILGHKSKVVTKIYDQSVVEQQEVSETMAKMLLG